MMLRAMLTVPDCVPSAAACEGARAEPEPATPRSPARRRPIVSRPPPTTEAIGPNRAAVAPLSNAPISFDMLTNRCFTAETRPRRASGVIICSSVRRMTTLTLSQTPVTNRHAARARRSATGRTRSLPGRSRLPPTSRTRPGRCHGGSRVVTSAIGSRAGGGRRAQPAQAGRPHLQDVLGKDRQQRDGAAEQHGEQIQRDRRQEHRAGATRTAGRRARRRGPARGRRRAPSAPGASSMITNTASAAAATANAAGRPCGDAMMNAAGCGAEDGRELRGRGHPRVELREHSRPAAAAAGWCSPPARRTHGPRRPPR